MKISIPPSLALDCLVGVLARRIAAGARRLVAWWQLDSHHRVLHTRGRRRARRTRGGRGGERKHLETVPRLHGRALSAGPLSLPQCPHLNLAFPINAR